MNFPSMWHVETRPQSDGGKPVSKKPRHSTRSRAAAVVAEVSIPGPANIVDTVKNIVSNTTELVPASHALGLDSIVSRLPYKRIIEEVYENWDGASTPPDIPLVTRAYEESFMRECRDASEKPCVMMNDCECMQIDKSNRFIGTEFLLPGEESGPEPRMCVLCLRQLTQKLYYDLVFDGKNFRFPIQKYGNICNEPGEYAREAMLFCPTNGPVHAMPFPIVTHQRNRYGVVTKYGIRHLRQYRVSMQDYPSGGSEVRVVSANPAARTAPSDFTSPGDHSRSSNGVYPTRTHWCILRAPPRLSTLETTEQPRPQEHRTASFSEHADVDVHLQLLYQRVLAGEADAQTEIDGFIFVELLLSDPSTRTRLLALGDPDLVTRLRSSVPHTIQADNLPDLGAHIRAIVFRSGDAPPATQTPACLLDLMIYEALPNIKRTKQMRNADSARLLPMGTAQAAACVNVMLGTLLGLYSHAAKRAVFATRCRIVAEIYGVQSLPDTEKQAWLLAAPNLVRICFMEYVMWFISTFMPTELAIIASKASTAMYLGTYASVCDTFRQAMLDDMPARLCDLDVVAAQHIERCIRMCKFKMCRLQPVTTGTPFQHALAPAKADVQAAMAMCPLRRGHVYMPRNKTRTALNSDHVYELRLLHPGAPARLMDIASCVHQAVTVSPLPRNIAEQQWLAVRSRHGDCALRTEVARKMFFCVSCCLQRRRLSSQQFRQCLLTNTLQCVLCRNTWSVVAADMIGRVLYYMNEAYHMCIKCGTTTKYTGDADGWTRACARCAPPVTKTRL